MGIYTLNRENDEERDDDDEDDTSQGLCCLGGCLTGCSFVVLLLVILPAGVLLTFYSANNKDYGVLSAGILMIAIPLISVPVFLVIYYNRRRISQFRKRKVQTTPRKGDNENSSRNKTRY